VSPIRRRIGADTITIRHAPLLDDGHNNQLPNWAAATSAVVRGCAIEPGAPIEFLLGRDASLISWTVYAPPGIAVESTDRVLLNGSPIVYEVYGEPARWNSITGNLDYTAIILQKWGG
jgi:hypothetical protein